MRQPPPDRHVIHLNRFVSELEPALNRAAGPGTVLTIRLSPSSHFLGDPAELELALLTLVSAARDAMGAGGELTIDTGWLDYVAGSKADDGVSPQPHVRLTVSDTGHGIRQKAHARIFGPCVLSDATDEDIRGLDLPSVAHIVRRHDGSIGLESREGRGTRVHVCLPFAPGSAEEEAALPRI